MEDPFAHTLECLIRSLVVFHSSSLTFRLRVTTRRRVDALQAEARGLKTLAQPWSPRARTSPQPLRKLRLRSLPSPPTHPCGAGPARRHSAFTVINLTKIRSLSTTTTVSNRSQKLSQQHQHKSVLLYTQVKFRYKNELNRGDNTARDTTTIIVTNRECMAGPDDPVQASEDGIRNHNDHRVVHALLR